MILAEESSLTVHLGTISISDELWLARVNSFSISGREEAFRTGVRARDGKCVVSGEINDLAQWNMWAGYEAAHVFPLEHENLWIQDGTMGISKIHSVQNGLLMSATLLSRFNQCLFSVNPDVMHFWRRTLQRETY